MDYVKIYNALIERGKNRKIDSYVENHHIIPRCMGGSDDCENLVRLTPEEHYLAHQLLVKIYPKNPKLIRAAVMMVVGRKSNKMYGWLRRKFSQVVSISQTGSSNSQYDTRWINNGIECIKINNLETIPKGYELGRIKKPKKPKLHNCEYCGSLFSQKTKEKFCNLKCKSYKKSIAMKIIDDNLESMIAFFLDYKSINKTLMHFGITGDRCGNAYFSSLLKNRGIPVLKRRNSK